MYELNLPDFDAKIRTDGHRRLIYDSLRRKFVALTPEEWVRQHFVHYLVGMCGYPQELLANEVALQLNGTLKRCDTVIYRRDLSPLMIVEYKAPTVDITQRVFDQIARYNIAMRVRYLTVSNGLTHYCCRVDYDSGQCSFLPQIPAYADIRNE